jgi:hypothetical protein
LNGREFKPALILLKCAVQAPKMSGGFGPSAMFFAIFTIHIRLPEPFN